jgi:formylglycine-generating enzyme required for sulfatase activity
MYDPDSERWARVKDQVVSSMVAVQPYHLARWMEALSPIRATLIGSLSKVHRDRDAKRDPSERTVATNILAEYAAGRPDLLADLLLDSDEKQFPFLYPKLAKHGEAALTLLRDELRKPLDGIADPKVEEELAKRQANAAVAVLRMGQPATVWPMLKHSADPTLRSYLIDRLGLLGAEPSDLIGQLESEADPEIRRALILSLGEFTDVQLPPSERSEFVDKLCAVYAKDSDPGIHAAAEWLLRTWGKGERIAEITNSLRTREAQLRKRYQANFEGAGWYVSEEGQTMIVLAGPGHFLMGSPPGEPGRWPDERQHLVRINRTFAIGAKTVTVEEFRRLYPKHPVAENPALDCPAVHVTWYDAAHYCNWLSKREGLPESEWCYESVLDPNALPAVAGGIGMSAGLSRLLPSSCGLLALAYPQHVGGLKLAENYLQRTGYRLPTEAEMEFAIRAGATTSRFCGESEELLVKYGWIVENSGGRLASVGRLKPNDFGLFDMHGNVWCWCLDPYREYPRSETGQVFDDKEFELTIDPAGERVLRGKCYTDHAAGVRSASRHHVKARGESNIYGFRLARTIAHN